MSSENVAADEKALAMGVEIEAPVRLVRELTRLGARLQHVTSRRTGLSPADLSALDVLSEGVMGPAQLARRLDVTTAAATGIVDRLVARGHVERRATVGDRRRTDLHLTAEGLGAHREHLRRMVEGLTALDAEFSAEELALVERYLEGAGVVIRDAVENEPTDG